MSLRWSTLMVCELALVLCGEALLAAPVRANCVTPEPALVWSYPEDGAVDVPTDVEIWVVTSVWGTGVTATLGGKTVDAIDVGTFSSFRLLVAPLEPNTAYTLELEYTNPPATVLRIEFTTGDGPGAQRPAAPTLKDTTATAGWPESHACADVISAQDCFDTGQNTLLSFELAAQDDVVAWLVTNEYPGASAVWPADCGDPSIFGGGEGCFVVRAIGPGGALGDGADVCVPGEPVVGNPGSFRDAGSVGAGQSDAGDTDTPSTIAVTDDDTGCSLAGAPGATRKLPALLALLLALAAGRWRRFSRRT